MNDLPQIIESTAAFSSTAMSSLQILLSLSVTFLMAMFIYFVYKRTYNGVLYSQNFNITLVMTAIAINSIVIGISGNLMLSLGMVGALSIIRFRTAIKDPRDTAFIFWSIMVGIANGVAFYQLSLIASVFIAVVLWGLSRKVSFEPAYMLIIKYQDGDAWQSVKAILQDKQWVSSHIVRSDTHKSDIIEKVTEVKIKPGNQQKITLKQGGTYRLTGESTQGQLWIETGEEKITLILDNLTLSNTMGSAIFIASSGDANVILANGSQNFLADHPRQSGSISGEQNAPLYSKSDLKIEGPANATLTVNGRYKDGIVSKDDLDIRGGTIIVEAADDALYGKDSVDIRNAAVNIVAGDDGIKADNVKRTDKGFVYIENSQVTLHVQDDAIKGALAVDLLTSNIDIEHSKEGIESNSITIYSGDVSVFSLDDALNIVKGDFSSARLLDGLSDALSSEKENSRERTPGTLTVLGGNIHIRSGGDGFDSNGAARMSGGRLFIEGPNSRGDGYIDVDEGFTLTGGELLAIGNSSMAQTPSDTTQPIIQVNTEETVAAGTVLTIVEANGKSVLALTLPKAITSLTFSAPELALGNTYQIMAGDVMLGEVALTEMITVIGERGRGGRGKGKGRDKNKSWWEW